jgi:hypothetical protein
LDRKPKIGVAILFWGGTFAFSFGTCCTQKLLLKIENLTTPNCLLLFLCGESEKSSSLLMMHMSSLPSLSDGGGITHVSPNLGFGATHLGGRFASFEA